MKIDQTYNHLHAEEYLLYRQSSLLNEIEKCIEEIDANKYLKMSCAKGKICELFYDQKALNKEIKQRLNRKGWKSLKICYYVTNNQDIIKKIIDEKEKKKQKEIIEKAGFDPMKSNNEVDFIKDRIAVEVQFGKYFSVAYDLHVKHTFFYLQDEIEVGIEIIPTHKMSLCMDDGISWFENEVTNVIREGRNNPSVPIYIMGIESDDVISRNPQDYTDRELKEILHHTAVGKLKNQIAVIKPEEEKKWNESIDKAKSKLDFLESEISRLKEEYLKLQEKGLLDAKTEKKLVKENDKLIERKNRAFDSYYEIKETPPAKLARIYRVEEVL